MGRSSGCLWPLSCLPVGFLRHQDGSLLRSETESHSFLWCLASSASHSSGISACSTRLRYSLVVCAVGNPAGWGGRGRGGSVGGLGVTGPLLVDLLVLLLLSWLSDALLLIWALILSILCCVFLILMRDSKVYLDLLFRFALLLTSWSLRFCSINRLRKNASSLRRGSGLCAIPFSGVFP